MKPGDVYRKAARIVAEVPFSWCKHRVACGAIQDAGGDVYSFRCIFQPMDKRTYETWFGEPHKRNVKGQNQRVIALCFAAAMADAGDL